MNSGPRRIRRRSAARLVLALTGLTLIGFLPANAGAAGTGSISGTVTDASDAPVGGVCARAYDAAGDGLNYVGDTTTDSDGNYTIGELATGDYRIRFTPCGGNVLREWFEDAETFATATSIPVTDGSDTPDVDAQLARGGSISGRVLNPPGDDSNVCVDVYGADEFISDFTQVVSPGDYTFGGLETGQYLVEFNACGSGATAAREYYPDKGARSEAVPVSVTAGSDTPGIDAQLEKGATISGPLSADLPTPGPPFFVLPCGGQVTALNADGHEVDAVSFDFGSMGGSGHDTTYKVQGLKPGNDYVLRGSISCYPSPFDPTTSTGGVEYYSDKGSFELAAPISVGPDSAISGVGLVLNGPDPDLAAPDTAIDSGPSGTIAVNEATFGFSSSDPGNTAGFECKLDSGGFADCASPKAFSSLSEGPHTVSFRAVHAVAGNEDPTPATRTFTVDTPGPDTPSEAKISRVTAKGPARIKLGKKGTFKVRVTNGGNATAKNVTLKVSGKGAKLNRPAGSIAPGATKTIKVKVKPTKAGKGKLTFKATSSNGGGRSVKRKINVIRPRR